MPEKVRLKSTGQVVTVTGKSGDFLRVFMLTGNNFHHEFVHKNEVEKV